MSSVDDLVVALQLALETTKADINTSVPGTIVSYNKDTNRAVVRPSIPLRLANGQTLPAPEIVNVPIIHPASSRNGKKAGITLPIAPGDGVKLDFSQRSLEGWLSGRNTAPDDPRQFDLSDCVATLGLNPAGMVGSIEDLSVELDASSLVLKPDGTIILGNANGAITIQPDGTIILRGLSVIVNTPARTFAVEVHVHNGVQPAIGISGPPFP